MTKVTTDTFLQEIAPFETYSQYRKNFLEKVAYFQQIHPTLVKVGLVFFLALSIATLIAVPYFRPLIGKWTIQTFIPLATLMLVTTLVASLLFLILYVIFPPFHDPKNHTFEEKGVNRPLEGIVGELKYVGDLPILRIKNGDDPKNCGKTYGYLIAKETTWLICIFRLLIFTIGPRFGIGLPRPETVPDKLDKIKRQIQKAFPEYLREMEGFVEGYNLWCQENNSNRTITLDELLMYHLIPERLQFRFDKVFDPKSVMGCTSLITKDPQKGNVFSRNLDWESFGLTGAYSLALIIEREKGHSTMEITIPGLRGLTMMNEDGLCVAMNVAAHGGWTEFIEGPPALFFLRYCAENYSTVYEALRYVNAHKPLARFHLTLVDENEGVICHLLQGTKENKHYIEKLEHENHICTTNACFRRNERYGELFNSLQRERRIYQLFASAEKNILSPEYRKIAKYALALPWVNNHESTHSATFYPKEKKLWISVDNAYAGSSPKTKLTADFLFPFRQKIRKGVYIY